MAKKQCLRYCMNTSGCVVEGKWHRMARVDGARHAHMLQDGVRMLPLPFSLLAPDSS
jgi:hypothetical protein